MQRLQGAVSSLLRSSLAQRSVLPVPSASTNCCSKRCRGTIIQDEHFPHVGRKPGKTHYYEAFNDHLKDLGKYLEKEDRPQPKEKGSWELLQQEQLDAMRVVRLVEREIRVSPLRLGLVAKHIRGLTVRQAVAQLTFSKKKHSKTALQLLSDACREAAAKFNFTPDQLELEQIYVGKGRSQKKLRYHAKGKMGMGKVKWSHLNVQLREIDFDTRIAKSKTEQEAKQWVKLKLEVAAMTAAGGAANSSSDPNASYVEPEESTTGTGQQRQ